MSHAGCQGTIGAEGETPGSPGPLDPGPDQPPSLPPAELSCEETLRGQSEGEVRRLTSHEILHGIEALLGPELAPALEEVRAVLPRDPAYRTSTGFDPVTRNVSGLLTLAEAAAKAIVDDAEAAQRILGCTPSAPDTCREGLYAFAAKAFRAPLSAEQRAELDALATEIGGTPGIEWALVSIFASPFFHQHLEIEGTPDMGRARISAHELASRVAFRLTGAPDAELRSAADAALAEGRPLGEEELRSHAERLAQSDLGRRHIREALLAWLGVEATLDPSQRLADEYGVRAEGLGAEAYAELVRFVDYVIFDARGSFEDLMTDKTVFPTTERIAALYGVPQSERSMLQDERGGVLVRLGALLDDGDVPDPIHRGLFVRAHLLCTPLPAPSAELAEEAEEIAEELSREELSTREFVEAQTSGTACTGCHSLINSLGFALDTIGSLGELRTEETLFRADGEVLAVHPIDAQVEVRLGTGEVVNVDGAGELALALGQSHAARMCFASQLFAQLRLREPAEEDACLLQDLTAALEADGAILDVVVDSVVNEDSLYRRAFP